MSNELIVATAWIAGVIIFFIGLCLCDRMKSRGSELGAVLVFILSFFWPLALPVSMAAFIIILVVEFIDWVYRKISGVKP